MGVTPPLFRGAETPALFITYPFSKILRLAKGCPWFLYQRSVMPHSERSGFSPTSGLCCPEIEGGLATSLVCAHQRIEWMNLGITGLDRLYPYVVELYRRFDCTHFRPSVENSTLWFFLTVLTVREEESGLPDFAFPGECSDSRQNASQERQTQKPLRRKRGGFCC